MNDFIVASFKSRSQLIAFDGQLHKRGVKTEIISTPKRIAIGCGLSIKFTAKDIETARELLRIHRPLAFEGFYELKEGGGVSRLQ